MITLNTAFNLASEVAPQSLLTQQRVIDRASRQLSTGRLTTLAADSPHLVAKETRLQARQIGAQVARDNLNDGISLSQSADAYLGTMLDPLYRLNELTLMGMNDFLGHRDRSIMQHEANQLVEQLQGAVDLSRFNGKNLFDGKFLQQNIQNHGDASLGSLLSLPKIGFDDYVVNRVDEWSDQDLVFIVDNSGSMSQPIQDLANDISLVISQLASEYAGDLRVGIVAVSTPGNSGEPVRALDLLELNDSSTGTVNIDNLNTITDFLDSMQADQNTEDIDTALSYAIDQFSFNENAYQQLVVIGSAGDETSNGAVASNALNIASDFVANNDNRSVSAISTEWKGTQYSNYFQNQLVPAGNGSYHEYPDESLANILFDIATIERELTGVDLRTREKSKDSWYWVDHLLNLVNETRSVIGAFQSKLEAQFEVQSSVDRSMAKALADSTSTDFAKASGELRAHLTKKSATVVNQGHQLTYFGQSILSLINSNA